MTNAVFEPTCYACSGSFTGDQRYALNALDDLGQLRIIHPGCKTW